MRKSRELSRKGDNCKRSTENGKQKVVLVGANNLKISATCFNDPSFDRKDKSVKGWTPTLDNIKMLAEMIRQQHDQGARDFVFDFFGNIGLRYEQFDGTMSLSFKSEGRFHLGGKAVVCPADLFKRMVDSMASVFTALNETPCVIIPPMPRWIFEQCCSDPGHCTDAGTGTNSRNCSQIS
jgi:hypothetical protein